MKQNPKYHPEGDALYHSLQVFDLARDELPYDEEFLLAALLHDVGKAIDPHDHVAAGLEALAGFITERTGWLIEHHMEAQQTLGRHARRPRQRRLMESESYDELLTLARCDRAGRVPGARRAELDEAARLHPRAGADVRVASPSTLAISPRCLHRALTACPS